MTHKGEAYPAASAFLQDNWFRRLMQPPQKLADMLDIKPSEAVMDFGCGPGYYTVEFAKRAKTVFAVDISLQMLKKAQDKAAKAEVSNIQFLQSDGKNVLLPSSSVNKIVLITVYHEVADSSIVLEEFSRILKPDGNLIIVEVIKRGILPGAPVQKPEVLKEEIEACGFKFVKMIPYNSYGLLFFAKSK